MFYIRMRIWDYGYCFSMYEPRLMITQGLVAHVHDIIFANELLVQNAIRQEVNVSRETILETY